MSASGSKRTGRARSRWPGAEADQLAARYLAEPWREKETWFRRGGWWPINYAICLAGNAGTRRTRAGTDAAPLGLGAMTG